MAFEHYIRSGKRLLRCGYTTGTCAALAAKGAAELLLSGIAPESVEIVTPKGLTVSVTPDFCRMEGEKSLCGIIKDAGDDTDVTDGMTICAALEKADSGITVDGGAGVGRVTKAGLDQPIGAAAINRVPREMIRDAVLSICDKYGYNGGISVTISVPNGENAAKKTFNPTIGVEGGISILGTSGIVEPMSSQALVDTIELEQRQARLADNRLILTPGNYGYDYIRAKGLDRAGVPVVRCSNFIGDALDIAANLRFSQVLLVGHIGKLVKLAGGVMNTHSKYADCRAELFCAHAAICGADGELCRGLMECVTADGCIELLETAGLRDAVSQSITNAVQLHLDRRVNGDYTVGAVIFSNIYGQFGTTDTAKEMIQKWYDS